MDRRTALLTALAVGLGLALGWATPADAAVVSLEDVVSEGYRDVPPSTFHDVRFVAGPGEANRPSFKEAEGLLTVHDPAGLSPGRGCERDQDAATVRCVLRARISNASAELGDEDDIVAGHLPGTFASIDGGPGDDVLTGSVVRGGPGDDTLRGQFLAGGPGADSFTGFAGSRDRVGYAGTVDGVHADGDGDADDGVPGEGDRIGPGIEVVVGGDGADDLVASGELRILDGAGGDDLLTATGASAQLYGGPGADSLSGGAGDDLLHGDRTSDVTSAEVDAGAAPDTLAGGAGDDELGGGAGLDLLLPGPGRDVAVGGSGGARVDAVDADLDRVTCGILPAFEQPPPTPAGRARVDGHDVVRACARLGRTAATRPRVLKLGTAGYLEGVIVGIGCSQDQLRGCRGSVVVRAGGREVGRRRVSVQPGRGGVLRVTIPSRWLPRGPACRVFAVTVLARDQRGRRVSTTRRQELRSDGRACAGPDAWLNAALDPGW